MNTNWITLAILSAFASLVSTVQGQIPPGLTNGLVAYYPFNGNANDESGNGNNGVVSGATLAPDCHGIADRAYFFNGVDNLIRATVGGIPAGNQHRSLTLWARAVPNLVCGATLAQWGNPENQQAFGIIANGDPCTWWTASWGGGNDPSSGTVVDSQWHHLVATYDGTLRIFVDGVLRGQLGIGIATGDSVLHIGGSVETNVAGNKFNGTLDEVRIYNRALSAHEVGELYAFESPDTDGDGLSDAHERGFGRYEIIPAFIPWLQAKADAEARGGHLATITSLAEWNAIKDVIGEDAFGHRAKWLGASDVAEEGTWRWVTGEPWQYTRWFPGEPSGGENYLITWADLADGAGWNDGGEALPGEHQGYLYERGFYSSYTTNDTDGDGLLDGDEVKVYHTFPSFADSDQDGLGDAEEILIYHTNPLKADSDGDGLTDGEEIGTYATDPLDRDSDGDGLNDRVEVLTYHTNPNLRDTDGDGYTDYAEIYAGKDPKNAEDFPAAVLNIYIAIELEFISKTNELYFIQTSPNLLTWTNYDGPILGDGAVWRKTYSTRTQSTLFYRVEKGP